MTKKRLAVALLLANELRGLAFAYLAWVNLF